jgi:hypothetical protein
MICILHKFKLKDFLYREYKPKYSQYGIELLELHKCNKCGREKIKKHDSFNNSYKSKHIDIKNHMISIGFEDYYKYKQSEINNSDIK